MPTCNSCSAKVARTDAFCGTCGEPVPGAKPVVPIARSSQTSRRLNMPEPLGGSFAGRHRPSGSAQAAAIVALSEPVDAEPPDPQEAHRTAIRQREPSEPAPVLPLQRRKDGSLADGEAGDDTTGKSAAEESSASGPQDISLPNIPVPAGPPILASDLLREQMRPSTPGAKSLRVVTVALAAAGGIGALLVGGLHPLVFVSLALLVLMATLSLTPMSYRARAISLVVAAAVATGVGLWQQTEHALAGESVLLPGAVTLLSAALLFRAYYRGARLSRVLVAVGFVALGVWFVVSGGHESLVMLDGHWQSWAPAATHMTFSLLALLSLMAFMESSTRGGAHVWAVGLLALYVIHLGLLVAAELWPVSGARATIEGPTVAALLTGMVGTIVATLALAQVFVIVYQSATSRPKSAT